MQQNFKQQSSSAHGYGVPQQGFTLIETLIAIFILTLTVGGLLTLAAGGYFSVRYARNQIVADNLIQEAIEYIRNDRDGFAQSGQGYWSNWELRYTSCMAGGGSQGCIIDPYANGNGQNVQRYTGQALSFYPSVGFYGYNTHSYLNIGQTSQTPYNTTYHRSVIFTPGAQADQVTVTVTVSWMNGSSSMSSSQSVLVTNWNP